MLGREARFRLVESRETEEMVSTVRIEILRLFNRLTNLLRFCCSLCFSTLIAMAFPAKDMKKAMMEI
jgi:hypothetical protein